MHHEVSLPKRRDLHSDPYEGDITQYGNAITYDQYKHVIQLLARTYPTGEFENWGHCEHLLPIVQSLYRKRCLYQFTVDISAAWGQILTNTAWYLWRQGDHKEAQTLVFEALRLREGVLGPDNELTLVTAEITAGILTSQGNTKKRSS